MSLKYKMLLKESVGSFHLSEVKGLVKTVIIFTASCELIGTVLFSNSVCSVNEFEARHIYGSFYQCFSFL